MRIERWRYSVPLWLRGFLRRRIVEAELDEEIRDHIEQQTRANIAAGMKEPDARHAALVAFGGVERVKDESRDARRLTVIDQLAQLRLAVRALGRVRTFSAASVLTIALGVAAGSVMYLLIYGVLLRPLPYPDSDRLVELWHTLPGLGMKLVPQAPGTYDSYRRGATLLESVASHTGTISIAFGDPANGAQRVTLSSVTPSLFPMLRVRPLTGRLFRDSDVPLNNRSDYMIVSERFWRSRLGADPQILGKRFRVGDADHTIVGVLPAAFQFPSAEVEIWFPFEIRPGAYLGSFGYWAIGRMREGVTARQVQQQLQQILTTVPERFPEIHAALGTRQALTRAKAAPVVHTLLEDTIGDFRRVLAILSAVVATLVVVAMSNVASLSLARGEARRREFAVRATLGASRWRLWSAVLAETGALTAVGATLGIGLATLGIEVLRRTSSLGFVNPAQSDGSSVVIPRLAELHPDVTLLVPAMFLTLAFWIVATVAGSWRIPSVDLTSFLRDGGRASTGGRAYHRLRTIFVGAEVALSLVLLSGTGVLAKSLLRLMAVDVGFDPRGLSTIDVVPPTTVRTPREIALFYRELLAKVGENPSVVSASLASKLPLQSGPSSRPVFVEDAPLAAGAMPQLFPIVEAIRGYFTTMKIPLLSGRTFDDANVERGANEAVVGRGFAFRYWNDSTGERALGRRFRPFTAGPWYTIVGVVGDVRDTAMTASRGAVLYLPEEPSVDSVTDTRPSRGMTLVMRTDGDARRLGSTIEQQLRLWSPGMIVFEPQAMEDVASAAGSSMRFVLFLLGLGATCTLVLGVIGLYGVISYLVSMRTREIGIRIALGLNPPQAARMIFRHGSAIIILGAAVGVVVFLGFARLLRALVFDMSTADVPSVAAAMIVIVAVAAVATWIPARRAARVDPTQALRAE
jgi:predicted permease